MIQFTRFTSLSPDTVEGRNAYHPELRHWYSLCWALPGVLSGLYSRCMPSVAEQPIRISMLGEVDKDPTARYTRPRCRMVGRTGSTDIPRETLNRKTKRPVRSLPPSKPLTGPAPPRRSVCARERCLSIVSQTNLEKETLPCHSPAGCGMFDPSSAGARCSVNVVRRPGRYAPAAARDPGGPLPAQLQLRRELRHRRLPARRGHRVLQQRHRARSRGRQLLQQQL